MNELDEIEQKYGFVLPEDYRRMYAAGWLDVKGDNYFWLNEAEWMSSKEILNHEPEEYHKPGYVPFARTGGGDEWCWWPSEHPDTVVLCPHDSYDGRFFAPTFTGFIYRSLLEFSIMLGLNPNDECFDPKCDPLQSQVLQDSAARLSPYLTDAWRKTLEEIAVAVPTRMINNDKDIGSALLTVERYQAIVQRDLAFPLLNHEFEWMTEPEDDD